MMTPDEIIAVVSAFKEGKKIECKLCTGNDMWAYVLADKPAWNFAVYDYRLKKEPREFWINIYRDGDRSDFKLHGSKRDAEHCAEKFRFECIHVREVL